MERVALLDRDIEHESRVGRGFNLASGLMLATAPGIDAAILDVQLGSDSSEAIAEALHQRDIPFASATGYGSQGVPAAFKDHPVLRKPFPMDELERCLTKLLG